jgi:MFS transporter, FHS family, L-fucose permease
MNVCSDDMLANLLAVAQGLYAFNRFLASFLMMFKPFKPRYMLFVYLLGCIIFSIACMNTSGTTSIALLIIVFCFESVSTLPTIALTLGYMADRLQCCFATIFSLSLRGLGRHTKRGGSFLVSAISGGMVFPPMMAAVIVSFPLTRHALGTNVIRTTATHTSPWPSQ